MYIVVHGVCSYLEIQLQSHRYCIKASQDVIHVQCDLVIKRQVEMQMGKSISLVVSAVLLFQPQCPGMCEMI